VVNDADLIFKCEADRCNGSSVMATRSANLLKSELLMLSIILCI